MTDEENDELELSGWNGAEVPPGFTERMIDRWEQERADTTSPKPKLRSRIVIAAGAAAIGVGMLVWGMRPRPTSTGELATTEHRSIELGERAVAVLEPGAHLQWSVKSEGRTEIEQREGKAFYRVEPGEEFEVTTPAGTVQVTGTCFEVEVTTMRDPKHSSKPNKMMRGMAVGAALASAMVVTVYEGQVVLANDDTSVTVGAGQRAASSVGGRPRLLDDEDSSNGVADASTVDPQQLVTQLRDQTRTMDSLRTETVDQRQTIEALRLQVESLGGTVSTDDPELVEAKRCSRGGRSQGCDFVDPDAATLAEMARCGAVGVDVPQFLYDDELPSDLSEAWASESALTPEEREKVSAVGERFRDQHAKALRALYLEAGGDPGLVEDISSGALRSLLEAGFGTEEGAEEMEAAHRRLANERAGLSEPPTDFAGLPLVERYVRTAADAGNEFERAVAQEVGPERAHHFRTALNGWPGAITVSSYCE